MKAFQSIFLVILTAFFFVSCEDVVDVTLDEADPQITFDAILTNEIAPQVIKITRSNLYFDNSGNFAGVSVDSVIVSDQDGKRFPFVETQTGEYVFTPSGADTFSLGNNYSLRIYKGADLYEAESQMKRSTPIDSITYEFLEKGTFGTDQPAGYFASLNAIDQIGVGDCYWIRTYVNGKFLNKPSNINIAFDAAGPGANSDGFPFVFPIAFISINDFASPYKLGDKIKIEILGISRGYFDFLTLAQQQLQNGGLFAAPPVNVRTNFTKNRPEAMSPVGYFNVCDLKSLEVEILE